MILKHFRALVQQRTARELPDVFKIYSIWLDSQKENKVQIVNSHFESYSTKYSHGRCRLAPNYNKTGSVHSSKIDIFLTFLFLLKTDTLIDGATRCKMMNI